jgi:hypothetical protein
MARILKAQHHLAMVKEWAHNGGEIHHPGADGHVLAHSGADIAQVKVHQVPVELMDGDRRMLAVIHGPAAVKIAAEHRIVDSVPEAQKKLSVAGIMVCV